MTEKIVRQITSHANPLVQQAVKLHSAKHRGSLQKFIAEGLRTISTLIQAGHEPLTLFATEEVLATACKLTAESNIFQVSDDIMNKISTTKTPSGFVAIFAIPARPSFDKLSAGIVFTCLQDPGNAGTLIRTAAAMNKKTVVLVESVDPWNPKVVQASTGAIGLVDIFCIPWKTLIENKGSIPLYALTVADGKNPSAINLKDALIVIGSEGHGIPQEWVDQCDATITLPMPGAFESLNASVAGSIALYLAATQ
jgi:TrmH family RNA methyltransferase